MRFTTQMPAISKWKSDTMSVHSDYAFEMMAKGIDTKDLEASGRSGHWGLQGIRERAEQNWIAIRVLERNGSGHRSGIKGSGCNGV